MRICATQKLRVLSEIGMGSSKEPSRAYPTALATPLVRCTGLLDLLGISSKYCNPPCVQWLNATGAAGRAEGREIRF